MTHTALPCHERFSVHYCIKWIELPIQLYACLSLNSENLKISIRVLKITFQQYGEKSADENNTNRIVLNTSQNDFLSIKCRKKKYKIERLKSKV